MEQAQPRSRGTTLSRGQVVAPYWPVGSHLLGLLLAFAAQLQLLSSRSAPVGGGLFLAGLVFFLLPLVTHPLSPPAALSGSRSGARPLVGGGFWRLLFALTSGGLALLAYTGFAGNDLLGGLWYWLGAIFYFLLAFAQRPVGGWARAVHRGWAATDRRIWLALFLITLLAIFFRVYRLATVPAEMTSDHAEKLLDVYDVLQGWRPIFFSRNTGREMVQFYLTAALIRLTPLSISHLALKVGTAIVGIVTVPFTYFLGKELYGRSAGLLAAFFLAISHWHVAITRVGLRFPFTAAFAVPALFFLIRALRRNRRNDWLAAGLFLGAGLHTYTAMRIVPLLFLVFVGIRLVAALRTRREEGASGLTRLFWLNSLLGGLLALLLFLPLLRFLVDEPQLFWYRSASRAQAALSANEMARVLWQNVQDALLMFNYRGDVVPPNTIPGAPALGTISAALLLLGMGILLWRLLRDREDAAAYVLSAFFVLLLPSILSVAFPEENPSLVRTGGAVPFVMIIVSLPLITLGRRCSALPARAARGVFAVFLASVLLFAVADNYRWYFVAYDLHIRQSLWNATEMGEAVKSFTATDGELEDAYHIPHPHWVDTRNIGINAGAITWHNAVVDLDALSDHANDPSPKLYLLYPGDQKALARLSLVFPEGTVTRYKSSWPGKDFLLYQVPAR